MTFRIDYYHERVLAEIEGWPVEILADYAKLVELLLEHGPNLRMPHSRAMGNGLFEPRPREEKESVGRSIASWLVGA